MHDMIQARLRPVLILGPTAGGKSDFAVALAEALQAQGEPLPQILGADSMQVYRHMEAGTAKPAPELRARVSHHLIDLVEPTQRFTVHDWLTLAEAQLAALAKQNTRAILVGGTNLYLKALLEGMFASPTGSGHDPVLRAELEQLDNQALHDRLAEVDPASARRIHRNDRKKMIRALEVFTLTGQPISVQQTQWEEHYQFINARHQPSGEQALPGGSTPPGYRYDPILIGLDWPVELINRRINARVKRMFFPTAAPGSAIASLADETARLEQAGMLGEQARLALGYKQVLEHLAGRCSLDQAYEQTKIATRRYAKQQRTWLKRYQGVFWLAAGELPLEAWVSLSVQQIKQVDS